MADGGQGIGSLPIEWEHSKWEAGQTYRCKSVSLLTQRPMGHSQESYLGSLHRGVGGVRVGQQE